MWIWWYRKHFIKCKAVMSHPLLKSVVLDFGIIWREWSSLRHARSLHRWGIQRSATCSALSQQQRSLFPPHWQQNPFGLRTTASHTEGGRGVLINSLHIFRQTMIRAGKKWTSWTAKSFVPNPALDWAAAAASLCFRSRSDWFALRSYSVSWSISGSPFSLFYLTLSVDPDLQSAFDARPS